MHEKTRHLMVVDFDATEVRPSSIVQSVRSWVPWVAVGADLRRSGTSGGGRGPRMALSRPNVAL